MAVLSDNALGSARSEGSSATADAHVVDDRQFERHVPPLPGGHPERPERLIAARRGLEQLPIHWHAVGARPATQEELERVHDPGFLRAMWELRGRTGYLDPDTFLSPMSVDVARLAAGSSVALVDALLDTPIRKGIALLRPPGHHALPDRAMGFCLLNNVAIAAAHARARGLDRIAIVDFDVHHGNGTEAIFVRDPHVLYVSTHQSPLYPGTGAAEDVGLGEGTGYTVNVPLAPGSGDATYARAFERLVLPVLESYAPDLVLVSAGFDAAARDPLAQMELSADAFGWMAKRLAEASARSAGGRLGIFLEGGYDLEAIETGVRRVVEGAVLDQAPELALGESDESVERAAVFAKRAWASVD